MNNKQQLVSAVLNKLEDANIILQDDQRLNAEFDLWGWYPNGHYCKEGSVEELLSCLTEDQLKRLINLPIPSGIAFGDLLRDWGQTGVFQCQPTIMESRAGVPILRIRHDSYLHWMRGYAFQNSNDAYCSWSNGASGSTLELDSRIISMPEYTDLYNSEEDWERVWAIFRKAMILGHTFEACAGKSSFFKMLEQNPKVFEEFINKTDDKVMHLRLNKSLTLSMMREMCSTDEFDCLSVLELAVINRSGEQIGVLRFGITAVQFMWSCNGKPLQMTIQFPVWDKVSYVRGLTRRGDRQTQPVEQDYLYNIWCKLAATLLTLAGIDSRYLCPIRGHKFDTSSICFYPETQRISKAPDMWDALYVARSSLLSASDIDC